MSVPVSLALSSLSPPVSHNIYIEYVALRPTLQLKPVFISKMASQCFTLWNNVLNLKRHCALVKAAQIGNLVYSTGVIDWWLACLTWDREISGSSPVIAVDFSGARTSAPNWFIKGWVCANLSMGCVHNKDPLLSFEKSSWVTGGSGFSHVEFKLVRLYVGSTVTLVFSLCSNCTVIVKPMSTISWIFGSKPHYYYYRGIDWCVMSNIMNIM